MDLFRKPFIGELYGVRAARARHPYDRRLFRQYPVFPLFVVDTGAFLLCVDTLGAADGDTILRAVADGSLFAHWTHEGRFDWDLQYRQTRRSSMRNGAEMQAWINRLYFLLPIAQQFLRTGDERWAKLWFRHFTDWEDAHPFKEQHFANFYKESDLVWFDMQVCWRTLVLMHSVYLLAGSRFLSRTRWARIYRAIAFGIGLLLKEAGHALTAGRGGGNHFLQKGAALLYAGICFPEFGNAATCIATGKAILRKMMREEIDADGGSIEASPSYGLFIARQYVDAFVLMQKNGVAGISGLQGCIQRQYAWIDRMASPARRTLLFNDSCGMDVDADRRIVSQLLPLRKLRLRRSFLFRTSRAGRLANDRFQVYFDAMPQSNFWHDHHGRPNIVVFCDGEPLLVDSGCPNYDHFLRENYFTRSRAHNVMDVDEKPEYNIGEEWTQPFPSVAVRKFETGRRRSRVAFTHRLCWTEHRLDYVWTRSVALEGNTLEIRDRVQSGRAITGTVRFHFAPLNMMLSDDRRAATMFFRGRDIRLEQVKGTTAGPLQLEYKPAYDQWNRMTYTPCLSCTARGTAIAFGTRIVM